MKTIIVRIYRSWPIAVLLLVSFILVFNNYTPGTFLSGWDTLHPEFNFGLNFKRQIFGVFREEQGLGAVAAHSHMADLPRTTILYLFHFILPIDLLRYSYIFLNLIIGPIGMFLFLNRVVIKNKIGSFLGALFYLLNLGTMQQFIVPFEMFTAQYVVLPWLFLFATEYVYFSKKKTLLLFAIITLLSTPTAYAATLWYFYFLCFAIYLVSLSVIFVLKKDYSIVKKVSTLILTTLVINSFWLLPNLYFVTTQGDLVQTINTNRIFSEQAFLYNKEFGNFKDVLSIKTFLFDWKIYNNNDFTKLLKPWIKNLDNSLIIGLGYLFLVIGTVGLFYSIYKQDKIALIFIPILLISLFFFINDNPPTGDLYTFLQNNVPLFKEALRFPQNKVLGIFVFTYSLYFGIGQKLITILIKSLSKRVSRFSKIFLFVQILVFSTALVVFMLPAFQGYLIHPQVKIQIPDSYFEMFKWFDNQSDDGRIANLPIHSPWGWEYYKWYDDKPGFQGAIFTSFGIKQPILNRDFDRWSPYNEQYYREMSYAIYSQDESKLERVIKKYNIHYILFDKNIIYPEQKNNSQILFLNEIETLLANAANIQKVFYSGNLFVYQINNQRQNSYLLKKPVSIASLPSAFYDDFAYAEYKDYVTYHIAERNDIFYPFEAIIDNQNHFLLKPSLDVNSLNLTFELNKQNITYAIPAATNQPRNYDITSVNKTNNDCYLPKQGTPLSRKNIVNEKGNQFVRYVSFAGSFCDHYFYEELARNEAYLISITSRNISGFPLRLCVTNYISRRCDILTRLSSSKNFKKEFFLLPPIDESIGFDINIENFAVKGSPSINDLQSIFLVPFPYTWFSQIKINLSKDGESLKDRTILVFSRSFDKGWKAYEAKEISWLTKAFPFLFGKELKEHVIVNNWANGWVIDSSKFKVQSSKFVIIFLPQYLEYLGFGLLIGTFVALLFSTLTATSKEPRSLPRHLRGDTI